MESKNGPGGINASDSISFGMTFKSSRGLHSFWIDVCSGIQSRKELLRIFLLTSPFCNYSNNIGKSCHISAHCRFHDKILVAMKNHKSLPSKALLQSRWTNPAKKNKLSEKVCTFCLSKDILLKSRFCVMSLQFTNRSATSLACTMILNCKPIQLLSIYSMLSTI